LARRSQPDERAVKRGDRLAREVQVRVRLGAGLARLAQAPVLALDVAEGSTVGELLDRLAGAEPAVAPALPSALPVIAGEHAERSRRLSAGDEVALLVPVSGG
jgi:molybdopterin converting factor small subunit